MQLFADYIQPLTAWLHVHPHWALLIAFLLSFTESLAVIGSLVPGSVIMTAIGILAGSGVMRIDLTLIVATLGAIAGDSFSYMLGKVFCDRLNNMWPFSRYPAWLTYGKDYFSRHGGKSVLIGRFVGPIRAVIPVIAGMMGMEQWRFLIVNVISGILWSIVYVGPGILIGLASSELSAESATRLFVLVILFLGVIWLLSILIKWLVIRINRLLRSSLTNLWIRSSNHPHWSAIFKAITPEHEQNYYLTAFLCIGFLLCLILLIVLSIMVAYKSGLYLLNQPVHLFLQSLRTYPIDVFFIIASKLTNPINLIGLALVFLIRGFYNWNARKIFIWLSINLSCLLLAGLLKHSIESPYPLGLVYNYPGNSYPNVELSLYTAQLSFIAFYLLSFNNNRWNRLINSSLAVLLILPGIALIYLGDNWLTDILAAYCCGFLSSLSHWLIYRKNYTYSAKPYFIAGVITSVFTLGTIFSASFNFDQSIRNHQPYLAQYVITDDAWWNQKAPILPIYRTNRIGKPATFFNFQYAGSLKNLERALQQYGWQTQHDSFLQSIIYRISNNPLNNQIPFMAQLYQNKKPVLTMSYQPPHSKAILIFRLWRSNYHLQHFRQPIWLGSVHVNKAVKHFEQHGTESGWLFNSALISIIKALPPHFKQRQISLLPPSLSLQAEGEPTLLLVKEEFPLPEFNKSLFHDFLEPY